MRMRASRLLCRVKPSAHRLWLTGPPKLLLLNVQSRRHDLFSESARRNPGHVRSFSSTCPAQFMLDGDSTIYALSTAPGRAAIAVVRISGPACVPVCASKSPPSRYNAKSPRYTKAFAQTQLYPNPDMPHFALSTTRRNLQLPVQSLTPALLFFTSHPRALLQAKTF